MHLYKYIYALNFFLPPGSFAAMLLHLHTYMFTHTHAYIVCAYSNACSAVNFLPFQNYSPGIHTCAHAHIHTHD